MGRKRPPHPPRCLCSDVIQWLLGNASPTLYFGYKPQNEKEARQIEKYKAAAWAYFEEVNRDVH